MAATKSLAPTSARESLRRDVLLLALPAVGEQEHGAMVMQRSVAVGLVAQLGQELVFQRRNRFSSGLDSKMEFGAEDCLTWGTRRSHKQHQTTNQTTEHGISPGNSELRVWGAVAVRETTKPVRRRRH